MKCKSVFVSVLSVSMGYFLFFTFWTEYRLLTRAALIYQYMLVNRAARLSKRFVINATILNVKAYLPKGHICQCKSTRNSKNQSWINKLINQYRRFNYLSRHICQCKSTRNSKNQSWINKLINQYRRFNYLSKMMQESYEINNNFNRYLYNASACVITDTKNF